MRQDMNMNSMVTEMNDRELQDVNGGVFFIIAALSVLVTSIGVAKLASDDEKRHKKARQ